MPRYFYKEAAGTPLKLLGEYVFFQPVGSVGGSIQGVIALSDEASKELDKIAQRFGIREITEEQYNALTAPVNSAVYTRPVEAMQAVLQQPDQPTHKPSKPQPIKDEPRAVVKTGKL